MSISPAEEAISRRVPQSACSLQDAALSVSLFFSPAGILPRNSQQFKRVCKVIGLQINPLPRFPAPGWSWN
jgi:hypothetical protein